MLGAGGKMLGSDLCEIKTIAYKPASIYAHIEVLVTFLLVKNFGFLVIARYHTIRN